VRLGGLSRGFGGALGGRVGGVARGFGRSRGRLGIFGLWPALCLGLTGMIGSSVGIARPRCGRYLTLGPR
jgi:hypothetical protein